MPALVSFPTESIGLALIDESPLNPRRHWHALEELAASLKREQLEPIIVRPNPATPGRYELADGARRFRAAKLAGMPSLVAKICALTDAEMYAIILGKGIVGNVDPLTPFEEALAYDEAMKRLNLSIEALAEGFSRDRTRVSRCLALLHLPDEAKRAIEKGDLPFSTAAELARIPGDEIRAKTVKAVLHSDVHGGVMPYRAAKQYIDTQVCRSLSAASFKVEDPLLVPEAGPCSSCRFRAGNDKATYGDVKNPNTCMNPTCYERKAEASRRRVLKEETQGGKVELSSDENAAVFPPGEKGLHYKSAYVPWKQPPPRDLLKPEIGSVPAWAELCDGEVKVTVYVGVNQSGHPVDLVKLSDALLAVPKDELSIFAEPVLRRHVITKQKGGVPAVEAPNSKKHKSTKAMPAPPQNTMDVLPEETTSGSPAFWQSRAADWISSALEAAPTLPPGLRETGFQLLREVGASTLTHHHESESGGAESGEDVEALRAEATSLFAAAGITTCYSRNRVTRVACGGLSFEELSTRAQLTSLVRMLKSKASPPCEGAGTDPAEAA